MTIEYKDSKRIITTSKTHTVHTFTSTGTLTVTGSGDIEYLVVAGGGGGGWNAAGGGGAGGMKTDTLSSSAGNKTITVGNGGSAGVSGSRNGGIGADSVFDSITSTGGGGGRGDENATTGINGGSGGGGCGLKDASNGTGISGQGNHGAANRVNTASNDGGGGGGGKGAVGTLSSGVTQGGNGGIGLQSSINGTATYYAGGGGGATGVTSSAGNSGNGGLGGGGKGAYWNGSSSIAPVAGTANTGGGGGGGEWDSHTYQNGAAGGSGIVIIRYAVDSGITATGGTITTIDTVKPTNVQDNSILVEKDTAKRYWFDEATPITYPTSGVLPTGTTTTDWTLTGTTISSSALNFNSAQASTQNDGVYDLGSALSDTAFVVRFKYTIANLTNGANSNVNAYLGLFSGTGNFQASQDYIGLSYYTASSTNYFYANAENNSGIDETGNTGRIYDGSVSATTYYVEIKRTGATSGEISIGTNSDFTTGRTTQTTFQNGVVAGITGLRYIGIKNRSNVPTLGAAVFNGTVSDIEVYNGVTSVTPATWTMVPWKHYVHYPVEKLRGLIAGGEASGRTNVIEYLTIASTGNATDFGDLTVERAGCEAVGSDLRGIFAGGNPTSNDRTLMDYVTIATTGNATDFGDLTVGRYNPCGVSSYVRGVLAGDDSYGTVMDYITIATLGNATDFGDLTYGHSSMAGVSDQLLNGSTRGIFGGGAVSGSTHQDAMDYITIATLGNATDFGNLTQARYSPCGVNSDVRGVFCGGYIQGSGDTNIMDYITIDTTGNATDFGDLSVGNQTQAGVSSTTRGVMAGGHDGAKTENIGYITIANTGNESNFGDLSVAKNNCGGI